jgi:hypothetical protein
MAAVGAAGGLQRRRAVATADSSERREEGLDGWRWRASGDGRPPAVLWVANFDRVRGDSCHRQRLVAAHGWIGHRWSAGGVAGWAQVAVVVGWGFRWWPDGVAFESGAG